MRGCPKSEVPIIRVIDLWKSQFLFRKTFVVVVVFRLIKPDDEIWQVIGDGVQVVINGLRLQLWPAHSEDCLHCFLSKG